jgi:hypothetical protein
LGPACRYRSSLEFKGYSQNETEWQDGIIKEFFLFFGEPKKFARISLQLTTLGQMCYVDTWVNPSGFRNLEYDPQKQAK